MIDGVGLPPDRWMPSTADVEQGFADLHKFATDRHGLVVVHQGRVVIMLPGDPRARMVS